MDTQQPPLDVACPIKHRPSVQRESSQHNLKYVSTVVQQGTGQQAYWFECEFSETRWFIIDGNKTDRESLRPFEYKRPHYGWRD